MIRSVVLAGILLLVALAAPASAGEGRLAVFDTGASAAEPLGGEAVAAQAGWTKVEDKAYAFKGDAVLATNRIALVIRQKGAAVEVYGKSADGAKLRGKLVPLGLAAPVTVSAVKVTANDRAAATIEATFKGGGKEACVAFTLTPDSRIAKTEPRAGATGLRLEASCRLGVLPDFFADDMVIDARAIPVERTELPSEHFFMQMLPGGDSILTAIWDKSQRDVEITLAGEKDTRQITGVEILYEGGAIWVAVLEQKGIWATTEITAENVQKVTVLDWKIPFRARWKGDFMRVDRTVDSWDFLWNPSSRGGWSGVVGGYDQPCWTSGKDEQKASIQPATKFPNGSFAGPFVVYPIDRTAETPVDQMTVTDLMRGSLGEGPCEFIMDTAAQGVANKGIYTCSVNNNLPSLFEFGFQKDERVFIEKMLDDVQVFVKAIQDRINGYVDFREEMLKYLAEQKKAKPELAEFIGKLEAQTQRIQAKKVDGATPVANLVAQLRPAITADVPKVSPPGITDGIMGIGLGQDNAVARCRNSVKILRQMATIEMAVNPKSAEVAREVRKRTQQALRNPLGHEMR